MDNRKPPKEEEEEQMHRLSQLNEMTGGLMTEGKSDLEILADTVDSYDITHKLPVQKDMDAISSVVERFRSNKYIVANALFESAIWYVITNFHGIEVDWENPSELFRDIKRYAIDKLKPKGGS